MRRAEIFMSYQWGRAVRAAGGLGSAEERQEFETQQLVVNLKAGIERNTRLHCWLDIERMGAGEAIREQVYDGVCHADIFLCCLTDAYLRSRNCMMELDVAIKQAKQIVPVSPQALTPFRRLPSHPASSFFLPYTAMPHLSESPCYRGPAEIAPAARVWLVRCPPSVASSGHGRFGSEGVCSLDIHRLADRRAARRQFRETLTEHH